MCSEVGADSTAVESWLEGFRMIVRSYGAFVSWDRAPANPLDLLGSH